MNMLAAQLWESTEYRQFLSAHGQVQISVCNNTEDRVEAHCIALAVAIGDIKPEALAALSPTEIDEATFHGDWYDLAVGQLVHNGTVNVDGITHQMPQFRDIPPKVRSSSGHIPPLWTPGGFAYAFANPPYGLNLSPSEIQILYAGIIARMAPRGKTRCLSWHSEEILTIAPQLDLGTEWWGVFAMTIYNRATQQVFGIAASTTD
jgi:hypothetical protein